MLPKHDITKLGHRFSDDEVFGVGPDRIQAWSAYQEAKIKASILKRRTAKKIKLTVNQIIRDVTPESIDSYRLDVVLNTDLELSAYASKFFEDDNRLIAVLERLNTQEGLEVFQARKSIVMNVLFPHLYELIRYLKARQVDNDARHSYYGPTFKQDLDQCIAFGGLSIFSQTLLRQISSIVSQ